MAKSKPWYNKVWGWLIKIGPAGIALAVLVYQYMNRKLQREEVLRENTELKVELLENEKEINEQYDGLSDIDVIEGAISIGSELQDEGE